MALFAFFHSWHLIIAVVTAGLVVARLYQGRAAGYKYVMQAAGY
jgi:hypothetical protein